MNEQQFYKAVTCRAKETGINPLLLLSGIEGLYTFKDVQLKEINYSFLDNLILTIFALRIGDHFHTQAEENLTSTDYKLMQAAAHELKVMTPEEIAQSPNQYLQSFATILNGKSLVRKYHEKALEVAALEINKALHDFSNASIGSIVIDICKTDDTGELNLKAIFSQ